MIKTEIIENGRIHTWSDLGMKIMQETGVIYDDAIDVIQHTYTETDIPIHTEEETDERNSI